MLFKDKKRTSQRGKSYIETDWDYLDSSGRIEAQRVRDFLNKWVARYPDIHRSELVSRLRAGDSNDFRSATFELVLFALFESLGCTIVIHPDMPNGVTKRPDFLINTPAKEPVYVEAVMASEYSAAEISARKRKDVVLHSIDKISSPNFLIGIHVDGNPKLPPNGRRLRRKLERWLGSLDPDAVIRDIEARGNEAIPHLEVHLDNWDIEFDAFPRKPERRGEGKGVIGALSSGVRYVNTWEPIRDSVRSKGGRYGKPPHPLVIAVNVDAISVDRIDEMQGLFGQEEYVFNRDNLSGDPQMRRKPNGAWTGKIGPQYTRVSGVWIFQNLNTWNIVSRVNSLLTKSVLDEACLV